MTNPQCTNGHSRPAAVVGPDAPPPAGGHRRAGPTPSRENRPVLIAATGPAVLAHQGGWDEALMVLVPIAVFTGLLALANRRAKALQARRTAPGRDRDRGEG